jgi:N-acylglucosamine-6-phosphate 2-epimerase
MSDLNLARAELEHLTGGLVVSCQAREDNPLHGPGPMALMARAAELGGAVGIRANGAADIAAIRGAVDLPILGINKQVAADGSVFITPTAASANQIIQAGTWLVALDGTVRPRPGGESLSSVVAAIHAAGALALADVATIDDAEHSVAAGVDAVGTTLSGYTPDSPRQDGPDLELLAALVAGQTVPIFAEGRIWTPEQARRALDLGAAFVVVGTAITNPMATTARFVSIMTAREGA